MIQLCQGTRALYLVAAKGTWGPGKGSVIARNKRWSWTLWPCLVNKNFQDSSSHRIFGRMYRALNIDENKN